MKWISTKEELPPEGKYVLARHNRGTWHDGTDQENVNCVVVKLVKGISKDEREKMKSGELPSKIEKSIHFSELFGSTYVERERYNVYRPQDEEGNNKKPYRWETFGPDSFYGQTITHWIPIPSLET